MYAEKTGPTTSTYGPRWTELGNRGGKTQAITAGINPSISDNVNHTYMTVRQTSGDQWDVLYDFNLVGSTTDQLKIPRGNSNRIDIGLEVMGPQHSTVPEIANRMQYMAENKTWYRASVADTAQVTSLGICGQPFPSTPGAVYTALYCFNAKLTDAANFTQWTVGKPGPASVRAAMPPTSTGKLNGVDQKALSRCMAADPDTCLTSVPGLAACVQTVKICNAAALQDTARSSERKQRRVPEAALRTRAAALFSVPRDTLRITSGTPALSTNGAVSPSTQSPAAVDPAVITVESSALTTGLEQRGLTFHGFRASYSA